MRRTIHALVLVMIATLLTALIGTPSSAQAPGSTTVNGTLSVEPAIVTVGQKVKVGANFSSGSFTVTLYRQVSGSSTWTAVASKPANEFGNAWFNDVQIDTKQKLYARATNGKTGITNTKTITPTPKAEPSANPTGVLTAEPSFFTEDQQVKIVADFPSGEFDVTLFRKAGDLWAPLSKVRSNSSGNASFTGYTVQGGEQLFAQKSNGDTTNVKTLTVTPINPDDPIFTQGGTIGKSGTVQDGRIGTVVANFASGTHQVTLFKKDGLEWKGVGSATSNSSGDASIKIEFDGPQELFAATSKGVRTDVKTITPSAPNENITSSPSTLGKKVIYVTTNNGGTPTTKGVDYEGKTVLVENGVPTETLDLETIAVRGNSTADKPKKPYKFKFDSKESPFGMPEDKTWVLLANYLDWTLVRSMVAWDLGDVFDVPKAMKWYPRSQFAELFINGKYMGSYQLVESIKIQDERVDIKPKWGQIIENDPHWATDGVPGFKGVSGMNYAWKDPDEFKTLDEEDCDEVANPTCVDPEGLTAQKIDLMKNKIKQFETVLYGANGTKDWSTINYATLDPKDDWQSYLDIDSAVDYYLTREFTKDNDADFYRSNFFHMDDVRNDWSILPTVKFAMGPIWDFDRSAGANTKSGTSNPLPTGWWIRGDGSPTHDTNKIHWFTRITKDPRFLNKLHDRWAAVRAEMQSTFVDGPAVTNAVTKLGGNDYALGQKVAANDRARWPDHDSRFDQRASSYSGELTWLRKWYKDRFTWMDNELQKTPPAIP
jgi:hypothetical protein